MGAWPMNQACACRGIGSSASAYSRREAIRTQGQRRVSDAIGVRIVIERLLLRRKVGIEESGSRSALTCEAFN